LIRKQKISYKPEFKLLKAARSYSYDKGRSRQLTSCGTLTERIQTTPMRAFLRLTTAATIWVIVLAFSIPSRANTCSAKRIKVKEACGVVLDYGRNPLDGATVQVLSGDDRPVSATIVTQSDGRFSFVDIPAGDYRLYVTAPQHNTVRWPLKISGKTSLTCKKPLVVHLAGYLGAGCGDWVDKK
jgi:hypothetical protein